MEQKLGTKIGAATVFSALLDTENAVQIVFDRDILSELKEQQPVKGHRNPGQRNIHSILPML